jgi:hypothetical protein
MGWTAIDHVYRNATDLDATAKAVLLAVAYHANRHGRAWPSLATLSCETGLSRSTVQRAIKKLTESGHLQVIHRAGKGVTLTLGGVTDDRNGCHSDTRTSKNRIEPAAADRAATQRDDAGRKQPARGAWSDEPSPSERTAIENCLYCDDHGYLWKPDGTVGHCSHRIVRRVTDLTVADILNQDVLTE